MGNTIGPNGLSIGSTGTSRRRSRPNLQIEPANRHYPSLEIPEWWWERRAGTDFRLTRTRAVNSSSPGLRRSAEKGGQKASIVWSIGTQPFKPAVYGVKAPL